MKRVVILKVGKRNIELLKILGVMVMLASIILMISSVSDVFLRVKQVNSAISSNNIALLTFHMPSNQITPELVVGYLLPPIGYLLLWLGLFVIGVMVYKSGALFLPIEEEIKDVG